MNTIKRFASKCPLAFGLMVTLVFILMLVVSAVLGNLWPGESIYGQPGAIVGRLIAIALLLSMLAGLGWLRSVGFTSSGNWQSWLWLLLTLA
jgi:hypothetical protein